MRVRTGCDVRMYCAALLALMPHGRPSVLPAALLPPAVFPRRPSRTRGPGGAIVCPRHSLQHSLH